MHTKTSLTLDIDGTVLTVYGNQQRAEVGYNPKKRGKKSYCFMLCFEGNREFWYGSLEPGNISQVKVAPSIVKKCLEKLPYPIYRIRIRCDAAFYSGEFIEDNLERDAIGYTIEAQITAPLVAQMEKATYERYQGSWETAEFYYQPKGWETSHRFVVLRRPLPEDPGERLQLKLFELKNYGYRVLVTSLKLKPRNIWHFHSQRAHGAEQNIKELKMNYPLAKIPTKSYTANVAYFQILLLAFNIINWFKWLCLPEEYQYVALQTIRERLLSVPARLTRTNNKNRLKFPAGYPYEDMFHIAVKNIQRMKPL